MSEKRGYLPEDEENFSPSALETLMTASRHIAYLYNEGYDLLQATDFVGNHYTLSSRQRLALARGIATDKQIQSRKAKEVTGAAGAEVWVDGFNTVITLEVMLSGSPIFKGMDGALRDLAGLRGTYRIIPETETAVGMLFDELEKMQVKRVNILLDEPVSNSGKLKVLMAEMAENRPFETDITLLKEVDKTLWDKEYVITSDSMILDKCRSWINLTARCLEKSGVKPKCEFSCCKS